MRMEQDARVDRIVEKEMEKYDRHNRILKTIISIICDLLILLMFIISITGLLDRMPGLWIFTRIVSTNKEYESNKIGLATLCLTIIPITGNLLNKQGYNEAKIKRRQRKTKKLREKYKAIILDE